jgi:hypothetical protein
MPGSIGRVHCAAGDRPAVSSAPGRRPDCPAWIRRTCNVSLAASVHLARSGPATAEDALTVEGLQPDRTMTASNNHSTAAVQGRATWPEASKRATVRPRSQRKRRRLPQLLARSPPHGSRHPLRARRSDGVFQARSEWNGIPVTVLKEPSWPAKPSTLCRHSMPARVDA